MAAEGLSISAEINSDRIIAGGKSKEDSSQEDHEEPASKIDKVHTFSWEQFGVVDLLDERVGLVVTYFHYYNEFIRW